MRYTIVVTLLAAFSALPACAHVTLADRSANAGSYFVATFRVGHGCSGSPTTALRIEIADGIAIARPQPKPGWTLAIDHAALASPQKGEMGEPVTSRVSAITWSGGSLPADEFDEFSMMLVLPKVPGKLAFPATQTCANGTVAWHGEDQRHPAPVLTLVPAAREMLDMPGMDMHGH